MKKTILFLLAVLTASVATARDRRCFDSGWLFTLGDDAAMSTVGYDDSSWRHLDLPHDWAIEGDFMASNPSGASGGALPGGIGWYRKHFSVEELRSKELSSKESDGRYFIEFDGVYMNSTVYINGHEVGHRPYGYSSFEYEITPYINKVGDNVVAVKVDNSDQPNSRWYSGCGIYRHVWLTATADTRIAHWGVHVVTTPKGKVNIDVDIDGNRQGVTVRNRLYDQRGREVKAPVRNPRRWSVDNPVVYTVKTELVRGGSVIDEVETTTGFRDFRFDPATGFWLNGKNLKLNGVCEHHDLGCLGAAFSEDAMRRKLVKLKEMGVNAIRCSHNPPAPELLALCDTMGLIVMDESFDMWRRRKTQNDYARFFDEWHERDLADLVLRDRNHPSVLMWSIGNEVLEQWSSAEADTLTLEQANLILNAGHDASTLAKEGELSVNSLLTRHLADIVKRYDTTRPITAGCNEPDPNNHLFRSGALDIVGFNYHHQWAKDVPVNFPGKPFIFSESVSALQTRDFYMMPSDSVFVAPKEWWLPYTDPSMKCSAYDNMHASWSSTHEEMWDVVKNSPYVGGQFIWTGFDYIGEPTPYGFPARSSYFGIIDLAGFPKDVYYMYQSEWTDRDVLHLFPHWNWIPGEEVDLWCYYNHADEVELFINGKSQGVRTKELRSKESGSKEPAGMFTSHTRIGMETPYHVAWRVKFEPGEVRVVAKKDGNVVREQTIHTAGPAHHLKLTVDYAGQDLTFVNVEVVDKDGHRCPNAGNDIFFTVDDGCTIAGVDNGCPYSMERFKDNHRKAFFGKCLVVVRGKGWLSAKSADLLPAYLEIK